MDLDMKVAATTFWVALFLMVVTGFMETWGAFAIAAIVWIMSATYLVKKAK